MRSKLSYKVVAAILLFGVGSMAAFRLVVVPLIEHALRDQALTRAELYSTMVARGLGRDAANALVELERLARLPELAAMTREEADPVLAQQDATTSSFVHFALFDRTGTVVSRPDKPMRVGAERIADLHVSEPLAKERTFVGPVRISPGGNLAVTVGTPVRRDGAVVGVVSGSFGLPDRNPALYRDVLEPPLPPEWGVWLVSAEGSVIARSGSPPDKSLGVVDARSDPLVAAALAGNRGVRIFRRDGQEWLGAAAIVEPLHWLILAEVPLAVIESEVSASTDRLALIGALAILALVGLGLGMAVPMAARIGRLTLALRRYGSGIDERLESTGSDELGDALRAFNGMVDERRAHAAERDALIRELQQRNSEMERFTYTVSHDLKSPLITISSFARLTAEDMAAGDRARAEKDLRQISEASQRMAHMLDQLLELSRVGRVVNPPIATPLAGLAEEVVAAARMHPGAAGVEFVVQPGLPEVVVDRPRMVEVLQNLVDNAVRFLGDQAAPRIEIGMRSGGTRPVFYVADNGIGIAPIHHTRVFGLFERLEPKSSGTGIGLALVKRIIEAHDGVVWVESEGLGKGARFCFTIGGPP